MYILSSSSTTAQDLQFYTSSSQQSLTLNAAGDAAFNGTVTCKNPPKLSYTAVPTMATNQVGYTQTASVGVVTLNTTWISMCSVTLPIGVFMVVCTLTVYGYSGSTANTTGITIYQNGVYINAPVAYGLNSSTNYTSVQLTHVLTASTTGQAYNLMARVLTDTSPTVNGSIIAVRIA